MALSKSYTDTRGVMKRGVSESVRVPDTSVVKNQDKCWKENRIPYYLFDKVLNLK